MRFLEGDLILYFMIIFAGSLGTLDSLGFLGWVILVSCSLRGDGDLDSIGSGEVTESPIASLSDSSISSCFNASRWSTSDFLEHFELSLNTLRLTLPLPSIMLAFWLLMAFVAVGSSNAILIFKTSSFLRKFLKITSPAQWFVFNLVVCLRSDFLWLLPFTELSSDFSVILSRDFLVGMDVSCFLGDLGDIGDLGDLGSFVDTISSFFGLALLVLYLAAKISLTLSIWIEDGSWFS